jgi:hypothetical protein
MVFRIIQPVLLSVAVAAILILPTTAKLPSQENHLENLIAENQIQYILNDSAQTSAIQYTMVYQSENENMIEIISDNFSVRFQLNESIQKNNVYFLDNPVNGTATISLHNSCYATTDEKYTGTLLIHEFDQQTGMLSGGFELVVMANSCNTAIKIQNAQFKAKANISYL